MASFTIKKFPDDLLHKLKGEAAAARRSLTQEVLIRLEASLQGGDVENMHSSEAMKQTEAWLTLPGRWESPLTVREEIEHLYRSRTEGRETKL